jgi:hypothetical protein
MILAQKIHDPNHSFWGSKGCFILNFPYQDHKTRENPVSIIGRFTHVFLNMTIRIKGYRILN